MIEINNVKKSYISKKNVRVDALKGVSLTLGNTGLLVVLGKSGSGKSTLMNILSGIDLPTSGVVKYDGIDIFELSNRARDEYRLHNIGIVFQAYNLLDKFSVGENIAFGYSFSDTKEAYQRIDDALLRVGLEGYRDRNIDELSGGERQRVAIARAVVKRPRIIFLDEPTGNLDSANSKSIFELLKELSRDSLVVVITHDEGLATKYADDIIRIEDGKIVETSLTKVECGDEMRCEQALPKRHQVVSTPSKCKIAMRNMSKRVAKLITTILLLVITFSMIGVCLEGVGYDELGITADAIDDVVASGTRVLPIYKQRNTQDGVDTEMEYYDSFSIDDIGMIDKATSGHMVVLNNMPTLQLKVSGQYLPIVYNDGGSEYYRNVFSRLVACDNFDYEQLGFSLVGAMPVDRGEIAITRHQADYINEHWHIVDVDIIGMHLYPVYRDMDNNIPLRIVGILDTKMSPRYDILKGEPTSPDDIDSAYYYINMLSVGVVHNALFMTADGARWLNNSMPITAPLGTNKVNKSMLHMFLDRGYNIAELDPRTYAYGAINVEYLRYNVSNVARKTVYFDGRDRDELAVGEVLLGGNLYEYYLQNNFLVRGHALVESDGQGDSVQTKQYIVPDIVREGFDIRAGNDLQHTYRVVGYVEESCDVNKYSVFVGDDVPLGNADMFASTAVNVVGSSDNRSLVRGISAIGGDEYELKILFDKANDIRANKNLVFIITTICAICICVFGIMATIILANFVYSTLSDNYRDIGVLRALGASGREVGMIYMLEIVFIIFVTLMLGYIISVIFALTSAGILGTWIRPFSVDWWHLPVMIAVSIFISIITAIRPLFIIETSSPIDIINKLS